jgi:hypothetical protein
MLIAILFIKIPHMQTNLKNQKRQRPVHEITEQQPCRMYETYQCHLQYGTVQSKV